MKHNFSKLANGLQVVTHKMPMIKSVSINLIIKVGGRCETESEHGMSHFLEHMAFKGTNSRTGREIAEEFDSIGGHFNAYTSKEHTVYHAKLLAEHLEKGLDIIADIIQNSVFDDEEIAKEYGVICQEIAQVHDNPDDLAYEKLIESAFKGCQLGKSILGTNETIARFNSRSFKAYMQKHYIAGNMVLAAAGDVDHQKFTELARKLFANLPVGDEESVTKSMYTGGESIILKDLEQSFILIGFNSCSHQNLANFYHTQILSLILGGGLSSRLFQRIREQQGLAYSVGAFNNSFSDNGLFSIYAGCAHEKVIEVINSTIEELKLTQQGVTILELERAKAQIKSSILMAEEKSSYKSEELGRNYALFSRNIETEEILEIVAATTPDDIKSAADQIFSKTTPTLSIIGAGAAAIVDYNKLKNTLLTR